VLTGYAMAGLTVAVLYAAGAMLGVELPARVWIEMTALIAVGLLPFAALGVLLGHLLTADVIGPAAGGVTSLLALVSGAWFPLPEGGLLDSVAQFLPSYWLVQASHVSVGGETWGLAGWATIAAWTIALGAAARIAKPPRHRARLTTSRVPGRGPPDRCGVRPRSRAPARVTRARGACAARPTRRSRR
jgi:ABC-2 type transport system permease protein